LVKLRWLGHSAWQVNFKDSVVIIDPFLTNNPKAAVKPSDIKTADYVLVTHDHFDHLGDAFQIAKNTNAKLVGIYEISVMAQKDGIPEENTIGMNIGSVSDLGKIKVGMMPAIHSGNMVGYIISADGMTLYHSGDTGLFSDMKLIGQLYKPDVALICIGGFFTMSPLEAALAAEWVGAKVTIPMHYNTWPPIAQDAQKFAKMAKKTKVHVLNPGDEFEF